jgi:hypothetical protein
MAFDKIAIPEVPENVKARGFRPGTQYQVDVIKRAIGDVPTKYAELQKRTKAGAEKGLTGLGNYAYGDDPSTPEVEDDRHMYRKDKQIGEREVAAVNDEKNAANARGLLSSSFKDKNVGDALGRLGREAQQVITDYAGQMGDLFQKERDELNGPDGLYSKLANLYVGESDWLKENPEKPPPDPTPAPAPPGQDAKTSEDIEANQNAEYPVTNPAWRWAKHPNGAALDKQFGYGNYLIVKDPRGGWTVKVKG